MINVQGRRGPSARSLIGPASIGRYALIGFTGMSLDFLVYALLVRAGIPAALSTALSTSLGIINNYFLNALLNFKTRPTVSAGARFFLVGIVGLAVSVVGIQVLVMLSVDPIWAKALTLPVVLLAQFLANKHWSFAAA